MDAVDLLKKLISLLEGAPYPASIDNDLYTIWYEHSREAVGDALGFLNEQGELEEGQIPPIE